MSVITLIHYRPNSVDYYSRDGNMNSTNSDLDIRMYGFDDYNAAVNYAVIFELLNYDTKDKHEWAPWERTVLINGMKQEDFEDEYWNQTFPEEYYMFKQFEDDVHNKADERIAESKRIAEEKERKKAEEEAKRVAAALEKKEREELDRLLNKYGKGSIYCD